MRLSRLELKNYRNYTDVSLDFEEETTIFTGNNGQGKTNLLESIYYLSSGRSHKHASQNELARWGSDFFLIRAYLKDGGSDRLVEIQSRKEGDLKVKVDGVLFKNKSAFTSLLDTVVFSPEDLSIIKGSPSLRRDFLDEAIEKADSTFSDTRSRYQKVLAQRNSLIKRTTEPSHLKRSRIFEVWNENMVETGIKIIVKRKKMLQRLEKRYQENMKMFFEGSDNRLRYMLSWKEDASSLEELESKYRQNLFKNLEKDLILKSTSIGPHRDDICIMFEGRPIREYGSQGQQRSSAISLKLSELHVLKELKERMPVLLLDDALSELDEKRKDLLLGLIGGKAQTFITTANISYLKGLEGISSKLFLIKDNEVFPKDA
jgi:DNA replication and repair protein RecF